MILSRDTHVDDVSIEVSAAVVSVQWTKKDEGSLEAFKIINNKLLDGH